MSLERNPVTRTAPDRPGTGFEAGNGAAAAAETVRQHPAPGSLKAAIAAQQQKNPQLRARITGHDLIEHLLTTLPAGQADRVDTVLAVLGSLAGFSTVYALVLRIEEGAPELLPPEMLEMTLPDGTKRYFGSFLTGRLAEQPISLFNLTAGMAQRMGATAFPDLHELFARVAKSVPSAAFGQPRLPAGVRIGDGPQDFVQRLFAGCLPVLGRYDLHPDDYFAAFGLAIQQVIGRAGSRIDPALAVSIVMECAVPMSKLDPREVLDGL